MILVLKKWISFLTPPPSCCENITTGCFDIKALYFNYVHVKYKCCQNWHIPKTHQFHRQKLLLPHAVRKKYIYTPAPSLSSCLREHPRPQQQVLCHLNRCRREPPARSSASMHTSALPEAPLPAVFSNRPPMQASLPGKLWQPARERPGKANSWTSPKSTCACWWAGAAPRH